LADALANVSSFPLAAVVVTAIERDGTMDGPDLDGLLRVLALSDHDVVASGGVRGTADLVALARLQHDGRHLAGAIVGTALVEGTVDIEEAVAACAVSG
jgi:phosphoribosylformimino-5-aminoimidazole carboxamide ribonucleotide (ProFAR) isomerase